MIQFLSILAAGWSLLGWTGAASPGTAAPRAVAVPAAVLLPLSPLPLGLESLLPVPAHNPLTAEKIELGRRLFFDRGLSGSGATACASCHQPGKGFTDGRRLPIGDNQGVGRRNTPSLLNSAYVESLFWDGRAESLEQQSLQPLTNKLEMNTRLEAVIASLAASPEYPAAFQSAFGSNEVTAERIAFALASYQRTLTLGGSPFDRFSRFGSDPDFSAAAGRGSKLFRGKARCAMCHDGPLFADHKFHNTGIGWGQQPLDLGRHELTLDPAHQGEFKTPSLRNLAFTAPYMHDGSLPSLPDVIEFYNRGGGSNPRLDPALRPLNLSAVEKTELLEFLESLSPRFESGNALADP